MKINSLRLKKEHKVIKTQLKIAIFLKIFFIIL